MRNKSFGEEKMSFLDRIISFFRYRRLKDNIAGSENVIDMGCGFNASFLQWVVKKYGIKNAIGVDVSINKSLLDDQRFVFKINNLNDKIDLNDGSAKLVTSLAVIEHLNRPEENLKEIYRILSSGGSLILTTPAPMAKKLLEFLAFRLHVINEFEIKDHKNYFDSKTLKRMLVSAGFKNENIRIKKFLLGFNTCAICGK